MAGPPEDSRTDELFRALGDPTRRQILDLLAEHGTLNVSQISGFFPTLGRPNISKHLMALREAGLVMATRRGREQHYQINAEAMRAVLRPWVQRYARYWEDRLERLRAAAETLEREDPAPPD